MPDIDPSPPEAEQIKPAVKNPYQAEPRVIYEVRDSGAAAAAWWVGGLVAIVAILSVTFLVTRNPNSDQQVANAVEQGRLVGALESSQTTLADTQAAAKQAAQSAAASATLAKGAVTTASAQVPAPAPPPAAIASGSARP